ncbi:unnamed protein product [Rhizophagus irregularis]|nr:unnamed protein product [Rhizophagus irregularis]
MSGVTILSINSKNICIFFFKFYLYKTVKLTSTVKISLHLTISNNTELINNSNECDWIEEAISKKLIKFYEFGQFYNLQEIGSGGFGKIQHHREVDFYDNAIRFYGVTTFSSGRPPFCNELNDLGLAIKILQGLREISIPDTPEEYIKIYTDCWNIEPDDRPFINKVFDRLKEIIKKENIIIKDFHLFNDNKITQSSNNQQPILDGKISENIDSLHGDLSQVIQNFNMMNTKEIESLMSSSNQFENNFDTNAFDLLIPIPSPRKLKSPTRLRLLR